MSLHRAITLALVSLTTTTAYAAKNDISLNTLTEQYPTQTQFVFQQMSEDLASALSYKALTPAEPLGLTGFDVGIEISATSMNNANQWARAVNSGDAIDTLAIPKVHVHKGLPFGFDIGALYSSVPTTNMDLFGGEIRWSIIPGNVALPALALRGTASTLRNVNQLTFRTTGVELTVSKGFALFTPYAGIGSIWTVADPAASTGLAKEEFRQTKMLVGVNVNFGLINVALEGDRTGDSATYSGKVGLRF